MSRATIARKRVRTKGDFAEGNPIFPSDFAGAYGNTVCTVTFVERYQ